MKQLLSSRESKRNLIRALIILIALISGIQLATFSGRAMNIYQPPLESFDQNVNYIQGTKTEKELIQPVDGVDLVLNMDGWGTPQMKRDTYNVVITQHPIQYNGVKVFYRQDLVLEGSTLMSAADVMSLDPVPDLVNYQ